MGPVIFFSCLPFTENDFLQWRTTFSEEEWLPLMKQNLFLCWKVLSLSESKGMITLGPLGCSGSGSNGCGTVQCMDEQSICGTEVQGVQSGGGGKRLSIWCWGFVLFCFFGVYSQQSADVYQCSLKIQPKKKNPVPALENDVCSSAELCLHLCTPRQFKYAKKWSGITPARNFMLSLVPF